ncbi:ATP-binding protein [Streptomyces sp. NPDC002734]|uniref:ATP-binding protein n=1 Tax=Streptomyces sp. NPDC002734 TaxID=3154426 RepID=UPI00332BCD0F
MERQTTAVPSSCPRPPGPRAGPGRRSRAGARPRGPAPRAGPGLANSPFTEWDKTFGDARLSAAIAARIAFRCTLIQTGTESYRFQATQQALFRDNEPGRTAAGRHSDAQQVGELRH